MNWNMTPYIIRKLGPPALAGSIVALIYWYFAQPESIHDEHLRLAKAMLHGHLWVDDLPSWMERFQHNGHTYITQPPGPALLLLPSALFHIGGQRILSILLGAVTATIAWTMAQHGRLWLTIFLCFGTIFAFSVSRGDSWNLALVASVPFTLLAVKLIMEDSPHSWLVGLLVGAATLQRYDLILACPFYAFLCRHKLWGFAVALTPFIIFNLWFDWARTGDTLNSGFSIYAAADPHLNHLVQNGPVFSLIYLPQNLNTFLFMPPLLDNTWPYIHPHIAGQALVWTSPAFLGILRLRKWSLQAVCLLLMTVACLIPPLTYYANGWAQFGYRYAIQIYPFLFGMLAMHADENGLDRLDKLLICASVAFVSFGTWHLDTYPWVY